MSYKKCFCEYSTVKPRKWLTLGSNESTATSESTICKALDRQTFMGNGNCHYAGIRTPFEKE